MFLQLVTPPPPPGPAAPNIPLLSAAARDAADSLFQYHPLQISAIVEAFWRARYNAQSSPFVAWPSFITDQIVQTEFVPGWRWVPTPTVLPPRSPVLPVDQPGFPKSGATPTDPPSTATNWDHLIYAYLVENTRIFDIFVKVLDTYTFSERLETPSQASQLFWRNVEALIYGDAVPTMVWTTQGRNRRDEMANRMTVYYWMFGIDLSHAPELATQHPYEKPAAANRDFIPTFETLGREVWRGIVNAKNASGPNDTDNEAIATAARRIFDMMATRRLNGNLSREEFRAVALMSFLHLSIMYNSPMVNDLKASASSPEQRLFKIAERVGMTAHSKSKPFFDLAQPFSFLMQSIETGNFNTPANAPLLYLTPNPVSNNAEVVIDQYCLATGRDLKTQGVTVSQRATTAHRPLPAPKPRSPQHVNGHAPKAKAPAS